MSGFNELKADIVGYLTRAVARDVEKDQGAGLGLRTTSEIAVIHAVSNARVARALDALGDEGKVDFYGKIEGLGNANFYALADGQPGGRPIASTPTQY